MILDMAGRDLFGRLTGGRFNLRPVNPIVAEVGK